MQMLNLKIVFKKIKVFFHGIKSGMIDVRKQGACYEDIT